MDRRDFPAPEAVSQEIITEVASTKDVDALDLDPLYAAIDPDAVDTLVERGFDGSIEFRYEGCRVTVDGEGRIRVERDRRSSERFEITSGRGSEN